MNVGKGLICLVMMLVVTEFGVWDDLSGDDGGCHWMWGMVWFVWWWWWLSLNVGYGRICLGVYIWHYNKIMYTKYSYTTWSTDLYIKYETIRTSKNFLLKSHKNNSSWNCQQKYINFTGTSSSTNPLSVDSSILVLININVAGKDVWRVALFSLDLCFHNTYEWMNMYFCLSFDFEVFIVHSLPVLICWLTEDNIDWK